MEFRTTAAFALCVALAAGVRAQGGEETGRDSFLKRQAVAEMQRISSQIDVIQSNYDELSGRIARIENKKEPDAPSKAEIDSLRAEIASLRREMANMRAEIVRELAGKIAAAEKDQHRAQHPAAQSGGKFEPPPGKYQTYTVAPGDNLTIIAQAFRTNVAKIKEINNLKNDRLSVGMKLYVPKN